MEESQQEKAARLKAALKKKQKSLPILVMESDLYDWNPGARMLLLVLALGTRTSLEAHFPEDCPFTKEECIGWCDQAQWRLDAPRRQIRVPNPQGHPDV